MKRRFWMWIHDRAEKLWHYAYHQAYPKPKPDPHVWHYNITYVAGREFKATEWKENIQKYDA